MFVEITKFFVAYAPVISFVSFLIGLLVGNWQAIGRDRRKELLAISVPIHDALRKQMADSDPIAFANHVASSELRRLQSMYQYRTWLDRIRGIGFDKAVKNYNDKHNDSWHQDTNTGDIIHDDLTHYRKTIKVLLKFAPVK